jgi:hypothetical protein
LREVMSTMYCRVAFNSLGKIRKHQHSIAPRPVEAQRESDEIGNKLWLMCS